MKGKNSPRKGKKEGRFVLPEGRGKKFSSPAGLQPTSSFDDTEKGKEKPGWTWKGTTSRLLFPRYGKKKGRRRAIAVEKQRGGKRSEGAGFHRRKNCQPEEERKIPYLKMLVSLTPRHVRKKKLNLRKKEKKGTLIFVGEKTHGRGEKR